MSQPTHTADPGIRPLPLTHRHEAAGAVLTEDRGHLVPDHYGDAAAEEAALNDSAGLIDRSHDGVVDATGRDRSSFLQGMVTNDVAGLEPGQGCQAAFLTAKSRVQMLLTVLVDPDRLRLWVPPACATAFIDRIDRFRIMEQVELVDSSATEARLSLQGPRAAEIIALACGLPLEDIRPLARHDAPPNHRPAQLGDLPVRLVGGADDLAGGVHVWAPLDRAERLWDSLIEAGAAFGLVPVGRRAAEAARLRAGRLEYGREIDDDFFLPEMPMERWVSWTKGCYLGQEPVARVHYRGRANRGLVGLRFLSDELPEPRAPLYAGQREVGWVASVARSADLDASIGLGFARADAGEVGMVLRAGSSDSAPRAEIVALPMTRLHTAEDSL